MSMSPNIVALNSIVRKEVNRWTRIWVQTLLPPVITQTLYFVIFGTFIGSQLSEINGVSYMAFIVPGLIMMVVINNAFMNTVSSFFTAKFLRNYEEWMTSPAPYWVIIWGYTVGGMLRGIATGVLVFMISLLFTAPSVAHLGIVLLFITLTSAVFSLGGLINGIFAKKFDDISIFPTFILIPLTYFGGVFYSIGDLSPVWQTASKFNPILYMVDGFRYGFHGFSDLSVGFSLAMLMGMVVVLYGIAAWLIKRGVRLRS